MGLGNVNFNYMYSGIDKPWLQPTNLSTFSQTFTAGANVWGMVIMVCFL